MSDSGVGSGGQGGGVRASSESGIATLTADAAVGGQTSLLSPQRQSHGGVRLGGPWGNLGIMPSRFGYTPAYLRSLAPKTLERLFCAGARSELVAPSSHPLLYTWRSITLISVATHSRFPIHCLQAASQRVELDRQPLACRLPHLTAALS